MCIRDSPYVMTNWFGLSNTAPSGQIPVSVKFSFYIGGAVFLLAVIWTVFSTKEYSPEELKKFSESDSMNSKRPSRGENVSAAKFVNAGLLWTLIGLAGSAVLHFVLHEVDYGLYVLFVGSIIFGLLQMLVGIITKNLSLI